MSAATTRTRLVVADEAQLHRPKKYRTYADQFPLEFIKAGVATEHIKIRCARLQGRVLKRGVGSRIVWGKVRPKFANLRGAYKLLGKAPPSHAVVEFACDCPGCRSAALARLKHERGFAPTRRAAR